MSEWVTMLSQLSLLLLWLCISIPQLTGSITKPGCRDTCGDVTIPYPFGIGVNCYHDGWFEIECKASPPHSKGFTAKPFLSKFDVEVMELRLGGVTNDPPTLVLGTRPHNVCSTDTQAAQRPSVFDLRGSPYRFSKQSNVFLMEGCSGSAVLVDQTNKIMAGCGTVCDSNNSAIPTNSCYGVKCCQAPMSFGDRDSDYFPFYQMDFSILSSNSKQQQSCLMGTLMKSDYVNQYIGSLAMSHSVSVIPVVLSWPWKWRRWMGDNQHAVCFNEDTILICVCKDGYAGNPYLSNGCQVREECKGCLGHCFQDVVTKTYSCDPQTPLALILGPVFGGIGLVLLVLCSCWLYNFIKRRRKTERRVHAFKLMLQKHQSSNGSVVERTKVFTHRELDKATDHFNENRILGQGGQGTVYKGMLADGRIVAIKMSKLLDESQMEQFINEVVILSQINHRNIVKLLGCCLETEVPLLVYEFVPNGTLSQHIHDPDEDFAINWTLRLKIAADSAGAITYLHSSSSIPIYHRDIKSSNILLDDKYKAKVSDFGTSKTTGIDQTHLTTLVRGTMGYLDPEYFQSNQFTDKSDVYSFGVVLLELLTGKKSIYRDETMEQKNLVIEFLFLMRNSQLSNILDPQIVKDAKEEEMIAVANLARRCLSGSGRLRPTMKEVAMTLEMIIKSPTEMPMQDQQSDLPDEGFNEIVMAETSGVDFMSNPLPAAGVVSSLNIDVQPLLRDTI